MRSFLCILVCGAAILSLTGARDFESILFGGTHDKKRGKGSHDTNPGAPLNCRDDCTKSNCVDTLNQVMNREGDSVSRAKSLSYGNWCGTYVGCSKYTNSLARGGNPTGPSACNPTDAACKNHDVCSTDPHTKNNSCFCSEQIVLNLKDAATIGPNSPPGVPGLCGIETFDWHTEAKVLAFPFCQSSARSTPTGACKFELATDTWCTSIVPDVVAFFQRYATGNLTVSSNP